jgi:hypothetical protein
MAKHTIDFSPTNPENAAMAAGQTPSEQDEETPVTAVEQTADDGPEISVGPEKEEKADVVTMTNEEFAALRASSDSARAIKEGIDSLAGKLGAPSAPVQQVVNAPQESPEEFFEKNADLIFDKEKGAAILAKYTKMVADKEYGGTLRGLSTTLANTRKELLEAKDPNFKKYKAEIEQLVAQQTPEIQMLPDVFERAWVTVKQRHQGDIEAESVKSQVDAAVTAKLKELGIDPSKLGGGRPAAHVNSAGRSTPQVSTSGRPQVRLPDEATKQGLTDAAMRKGMDLNDLLRARGYLK